MRKHTTAIVCILASVIGGGATLLAFTVDVAKSSNVFSNLLNIAVMPGTIAYLLISGGEAGSTRFAETVAPFVGGMVNMLCYSLVFLAASNFYSWIRVSRTKQEQT
jgi:hypothetical protein